MSDKQLTSDMSSNVYVTTSVTSSSTSSTSMQMAGHQTITKTVTTSSTVKSATVVKTTKSVVKSSGTVTSLSVRPSSERFYDVAKRDLGIDIEKEMEQLKLQVSGEVEKLRAQLLHVAPLEMVGSGLELVKLDAASLDHYVDSLHRDRVNFNFDVNDFESETINVKTVGNKIEVTGKKKIKKGDEERVEEFTRSYEMPRQDALDPSKVTSSCYKDGVLTVQLPLECAIEVKDK